MSESPASGPTPPGGAREVFAAFLHLGLTAFGGPIAHLGYFHREFVERRRWLDESRYAQLLAVCQFLPGPASSQMGFALGLFRAGWRGAIAAFLGFTLPSALLMFAFAVFAPRLLGSGAGVAATHGLKLVAAAVVMQGVLAMARRLAPDTPRRLLAAGTCALLLIGGTVWLQAIALLAGALFGRWFCRDDDAPVSPPLPVPYGRGVAAMCASLCAIGLFAALYASTQDVSLGALAAAFYRAGALVFGGGHVVLPLLKEALVDPGWIAADTFLAGYGAAQAIPGPMFSLAAFLGAQAPAGISPAIGAVVALCALFLPGFLVLLAVLPYASWLASRPAARRAVAGVNAAVVGLLAAALYDPVWTQSVRSPGDALIALAGFAVLAGTRRSPLWVVAGCVAASLLRYAWTL